MTPTTLTFTCSICGEPSVSICVYCTKDACPNHLCERCLRCSDCCECELRLDEHPEHEMAHVPVTGSTFEEIGIIEVAEDLAVDGHGATALDPITEVPPEAPTTPSSPVAHAPAPQAHRSPSPEPHPAHSHAPESHMPEPYTPEPQTPEQSTPQPDTPEPQP